MPLKILHKKIWFHEGISLASLNLFMLIGLGKIVHGASLVRFQLEPVGQETLYVQFVSLVKIGCVLRACRKSDISLYKSKAK